MTMNRNQEMPSANSGGHGFADKKRRARNDLILIGGLLGALLLGALLFFLLGEEGDCAVVTVNGEELASYPLSEDRSVEIRTGENQEELNRLVIRDGKAFIEEATCPDGICAAHTPISHEGESIVCLPHRVVVTVE